MEITVEVLDGTAIIQATGLVLDQPGQFRKAMIGALTRGARCIVVDIREARKLDESAISDLANSFIEADSRGARVVAVVPDSIMKIVGEGMVNWAPGSAGALVDFFRSREEALAALELETRPDAPGPEPQAARSWVVLMTMLLLGGFLVFRYCW